MAWVSYMPSGVKEKVMMNESSYILLLTLEPAMGPVGPNIGPEISFSKTW
jgi:hypothetical protein